MSFLPYISHVWDRLIRVPFGTFFARVYLRAWGAVPGSGLRVRGWLRLHIEGSLIVGKNVRINSGTGNFVGGEQKLALWVSRGGKLVIADQCALSNSTIVVTQSVEILEGTFVGGGCLILDSDLHALDANQRLSGNSGHSRSVRIGPRAFVGARVTVLKGSQIAEEAVVGAGSVVAGVIPPREIWAGVPARKVGEVSSGTRAVCGR